MVLVNFRIKRRFSVTEPLISMIGIRDIDWQLSTPILHRGRSRIDSGINQRAIGSMKAPARNCWREVEEAASSVERDG